MENFGTGRGDIMENAVSIEYKFDNYEVGKADDFGQLIEKIYIRSKGQFVLYKCNDSEDISFDGTDEIHLKYSKITGRISNITGRFSNEFKKHPFLKNLLIYAITEAVQDNISTAEKILDDLEKRVLSIKKHQGRLHYLGGAVAVVIINIILSMVFINYYFISNDLLRECFFIFFVITSGSLGGMLSVSININKLEIDSDSGCLNNFITGLSRILISMIASYFIYLALKSNIIFGMINQSSNNIYSFLTFGLVSGFSETFVPNIINKIEKEDCKSS